MSGFRCQFCKGSLMTVHYPKLRVMAHLLASNILLLPKDLTITFICYYCSWCCAVWRPKSLPVHHPLCRLYFSFDPLRSVNIFGAFQIYFTLRIIFLTVFWLFGPFGNMSLWFRILEIAAKMSGFRCPGFWFIRMFIMIYLFVLDDSLTS